MKHLSLLFVIFLFACEGSFGFSDDEFDPSGPSAAEKEKDPSKKEKDPSIGNPDPDKMEDVLEGEALFAMHCSTCHGDDAKGNAIWPSSIESYEPIEDLVIDGRGTMPAIAISVEETQKIQDFLLTLGTPNEDLDGEGLFGRYCASCHGADAKGAAQWPNSIEAYEPIEDIVISGRGTMAAIPVTVEQSGLIQEWLLTLGTPSNQLDGKGLYDRFCGNCHGADALGTNIWMGSIQGYEPIADIVDNGRGTMAAVTLPANQVDDIQAYLLTLAPPLSTLNGPQVYQRLCVGCHGDKGAGDVKGMQLRYDDIEFSRYWIRNGRGKTLNYTSDMPAYPSNMISDQQIDEMFAEIDAVSHPTDGKGLFEQYCTNCHGLDARGGPAREGIRGTGEYNEKIREGEGGQNYGRRSKYMTRWNSNQISNSEIQKMKTYVRNNL